MACTSPPSTSTLSNPVPPLLSTKHVLRHRASSMIGGERIFIGFQKDEMSAPVSLLLLLLLLALSPLGGWSAAPMPTIMPSTKRSPKGNVLSCVASFPRLVGRFVFSPFAWNNLCLIADNGVLTLRFEDRSITVPKPNETVLRVDIWGTRTDTVGKIFLLRCVMIRFNFC
jgi:hypothetical protein